MAQQLPSSLPLHGFTVREAFAANVSPKRLRGSDLDAPFHGVRRIHHPFRDVLELAKAYSPLLGSDQFFSHETAARLWGFPFPTRFNGESEDLHVTSLSRSTVPRGKRVRGHFTSDAMLQVGKRYGIRVTDPLSTLLSLGSSQSEDTLVAIGDYLIRDRRMRQPNAYVARQSDVQWEGVHESVAWVEARPYVAAAEVNTRISAFHGRGKARLQSAQALMREGSNSYAETILRLLLARANLPEAELNVTIRNKTGDFVATVDLFYREFGVVVEYDGEQHRLDKRQYDRDLLRVEDIQHEQLQVVRIRSDGLFNRPSQTVERVHRVLSAAGWKGVP